MLSLDVIEEVRRMMVQDGGAHDWLHTLRVIQISKEIGRKEQCDLELVEACALFHDISDSKLNGGDPAAASALVRRILKQNGFPERFINVVRGFVDEMGFKNRLTSDRLNWILEWKVVQDADYLDAIGAVGIARAFWFGGFRHEPLCLTDFVPEVESLLSGSFDEKSSIGHFSHKLLKLRELMLTPSGRELAESRHSYLVSYLDEFRREWNIISEG